VKDVELWRLVVAWMRSPGGVTAEPGARDAPFVRQLLWELYMLGERPTTAEVRVAGGVDGHPTAWSRAVAKLWAERLRDPTRQMRRKYWHYFAIPNALVEERGLESLAARLAHELELAAREYAAAIDSKTPAERLRELDGLVRLQSLALRTWGQILAGLDEGVERDNLFGRGYMAHEPYPLMRPIPPRE
jgi:hypothetical protein